MDCITCKHEKIRDKIKNSVDFQQKVDDVSRIFSLIGEPTRMQILLALSQGELCVYHLCEITGGKQSAISQHLRKLKDNHIVKCKKEGNQVLYSLADEHIVSIIKNAISHRDCIK